MNGDPVGLLDPLVRSSHFIRTLMIDFKGFVQWCPSTS